MTRGLALFGLIASVMAGSACKTRETSSPAPRARNVILFIGDGLGPSQTALGLEYARVVEGRQLHLEILMESGETGYALPVSHQTTVTDSAAAATQIATGQVVWNQTLGIDIEGKPIETILERCESRGLATGLVTNMRLVHATPAAFASHQLSRYDPEPEIADQILAEHEIEVLLGGGARAFVPRGQRTSESLPGLPDRLDELSRRTDDRDLITEARERGYAVVSDRESLLDNASKGKKLLGLFSATNLPYVLDRRSESLDGVPSLAELTEAALLVLGAEEKGFFLMVEGGRIDYAGHDNDAGTMLHEILDFDEALGVASRFQSKNPDTLLLVTADHGTGGFTFTYSRHADWEARPMIPLASGASYRPRYFYPGKRELELLGKQSRSYELIGERAGADPAKLQNEVRDATGLELAWEEATKAAARNAEGHAEVCDFSQFYTDQEDTAQALLGRALSRHTSIGWSTGGHTTDPVLAFGVGPGAHRLRGVYRNTHIYDVMEQSLSGEK